MSDSLPPRESQHARPSCPSPTPGEGSVSRAQKWRTDRRDIAEIRPLGMTDDINHGVKERNECPAQGTEGMTKLLLES